MKTDENVTISRTEYEALKEKNEELSKQVQWLMEKLRLSAHRQFGTSSEKTDKAQLSFFNEVELEANSNVPELEMEEIEKYYRKKAKTSKERLPSDLPVEVIEHTLPKEEQMCPECDGELHVMGKETREELKIVPAKASIVRHEKHVYACRCCERNALGVPIKKAPIDEPVIKGSFASPEAIAHIITQKFVMGTPLYRLEQEFKRNGIYLSRQTMSNWLLKSTEDYLEPIYNALREILCNREVLHADETTLQVLKEPNKSAQSKSYMWLYRSGGDSNSPVVIYEYQPDRSAKRPQAFLSGFTGYLHTDGYIAYHTLPKEMVIVGCFAHARRKWEDALKSLPPKDRKNAQAQRGKQYCDQLFAIEKKLVGLSFEQRFKERQKLAKPVVDELFAWLHSVNIVPKTGFGQAASYHLKQQKYLERYLLDGRLEISNNRAERSIKPFVIGRKNFLFANTPRGAKASAIMYSLIETAKENALNPFAYLTYIFQNAPNWDIRNNIDLLQELLPWFVPDHCKANRH